jgi:hypothetical protein
MIIKRKYKNLIACLLFLAIWVIIIRYAFLLIFIYALPFLLTFIGGVASGLISIYMRFRNEIKDKENFFYVFSGVINTFLGILVLLLFINFERFQLPGYIIFAIITLTIGLFVLGDIFFITEKSKV